MIDEDNYDYIGRFSVLANGVRTLDYISDTDLKEILTHTQDLYDGPGWYDSNEDTGEIIRIYIDDETDLYLRMKYF